MKPILEFLINNHVNRAHSNTKDVIYINFSWEEYALQNKCTEIEADSIKQIKRFLKMGTNPMNSALHLVFTDGPVLHVLRDQVAAHNIPLYFGMTSSVTDPKYNIENGESDIHWQMFDDRETQDKLFLLFNKFLKENYDILTQA